MKRVHWKSLKCENRKTVSSTSSRARSCSRRQGRRAAGLVADADQWPQVFVADTD
jgi:hypothetical protein